MDRLLSECLGQGYRGVVVRQRSSKETKDWCETETSISDVYACRDGRYFKGTGTQIDEFRPGRHSSVEIAWGPEISREAYDKQTEGQTILDSPEVWAEFQASRAERSAALQVKQTLEQQAGNCPEHGKPLQLRKGPKEYFFGCPKYPKCSYKKWLTPTEKQLARSSTRLTNVLAP